ncbi:GrpB family protein [Planctomycetaceae bacterium SH139]
MTAEIRLMHYDPRWPQEFEQTRSNLLGSCEGWVTDVWHVGSTAISGLIARPVIDSVAILSDPSGWKHATELIEGLNFAVQPATAAAPWHSTGCLLSKPRRGAETHHVYLFLAGDPTAEKMLRTRDWLRANREAAIAFEEAKVAKWRCSDGDAEAYAQFKHDFFAKLK